jgi:hypothetical protein
MLSGRADGQVQRDPAAVPDDAPGIDVRHPRREVRGGDGGPHSGRCVDVRLDRLARRRLNRRKDRMESERDIERLLVVCLLAAYEETRSR